MSGNSGRYIRRRRKNDDGGDSATWLVTYADMVTLLMVFFVLMFTFSEIDSHRFRTMLIAFQGAIGVLDGGIMMVEDQSEFQGRTDFDLQNLELVRPELEAQLRMVYSELQTFVGQRDLQRSVQVELVERGVILRFADQVLFDLGRADLKPEAINILVEVAGALEDVPNPVRVEGHTDDLPINNDRFPSNWELSTARATNVIKFLIEEHGLDPRQFSAAGYGEYRPLVPNDSMENRARNRRVDIVLLRLDLGE